MTATTSDAAWPALPVDAWIETRDTVHMWTQIVGKIRMVLEPMVTHWWQVPLYVTARVRSPASRVAPRRSIPRVRPTAPTGSCNARTATR